MSRPKVLLPILSILLTFASFGLKAEDQVKPFMLATSSAAGFSKTLETTRAKLVTAGFEILGEYSPYPQSSIIIFTNNQMKNTATQSERGGYGGALRISITELDGDVQVAYTNPLYWSNAYRLNDNLQTTGQTLASAFNARQQFGSGDKVLTEADMRKYHYTFMMEYFDDPSKLARYDDHQTAISTIEKHLEEGTSGAHKVYRLDLGTDTEGKQMTLFGVALAGEDEDDCSADRYIMGKIDKSSPRHTAHLPYEMLVYGSNVEALYARFRIAISWPHLPMLSSDTGATFFSIMCAPGAIEKALTLAAGGEIKKIEPLEDRGDK